MHQYPTVFIMLVPKVLVFLCLFSFISTEPPETWKENWFEHTQLLTRHYYDDDVAIYFDPDVDKSITWLNTFYHDLWVYVKKIYGKFGDDPILYGVFHTAKYNGCHPTSYFQRQKSYRNVIDCGILSNDAWKTGTYEEYRMILATLTFIIQGASHGIEGWGAYGVSGGHFDNIIIYDIYLALNRSEYAQQWRKNHTDDHENVEGKDVYWFRDWFLPIYEKHGATVLNRFMELLSQNLPKTNTSTFNRPKYERDITYGEFFHFWSAATGRNLKSLASEVFGWKDKFEEEFKTARSQFPKISKYYELPETWQEDWHGHKELLTRQYSDDEIAVYYDKDVDESITWMNKIVRDVWVYVKKVYGNFGNDPILYAIFHSGKFGGFHASTYLESLYSYKNVIDCGTTDSGGWSMETPELIQTILNPFAYITENRAHGIIYNPAVEIWGWTWGEIFHYDIYLGINRTDLANRLYDQKLLIYYSRPKSATYWFRDWWAPIYEEYGGSKEFAATGRNLKSLASEVFGWKDKFEEEFKTARSQFPKISKYYELPETWQEDWHGHKELLTRQYSDDEIAVYYDKDVDVSITWMNKIVRDVWVYVKKVYGNFGNDPILYAIFHSGKYGGFHASTYLESLISYKNVIDCGTTDSGGWSMETPELIQTILNPFAYITENRAHGIIYNPAVEIWGWTWGEIFHYDIYLGINRTDLANRLYDQKLLIYYSRPKSATYWFRDWWAPIYEEYGGSKVLNRFFELLAKYFSKEIVENRKEKFPRDMNFGEFVYFWSGAAENNLKGLATEAFGWNEEYEKQYQQAKKDFPDIKFHNIILW